MYVSRCRRLELGETRPTGTRNMPKGDCQSLQAWLCGRATLSWQQHARVCLLVCGVTCGRFGSCKHGIRDAQGSFGNVGLLNDTQSAAPWEKALTQFGSLLNCK